METYGDGIPTMEKEMKAYGTEKATPKLNARNAGSVWNRSPRSLKCTARRASKAACNEDR